MFEYAEVSGHSPSHFTTAKADEALAQLGARGTQSYAQFLRTQFYWAEYGGGWIPSKRLQAYSPLGN